MLEPFNLLGYAVCITNLNPDTCDVKEWIMKPMRRQSKAKTDNVLGIKHKDLVEK